MVASKVVQRVVCSEHEMVEKWVVLSVDQKVDSLVDVMDVK